MAAKANVTHKLMYRILGEQSFAYLLHEIISVAKSKVKLDAGM